MVSQHGEEENGERPGQRSWEELIELLITQIEVVSNYFGYTEEYVMEHTPAWVNRKFQQVQKEKFVEHQRSVFAGFQSLLLLVDAAFNKGKDFNKIMPSSLEEAIRMERQKAVATQTFISGAWWR